MGDGGADVPNIELTSDGAGDPLPADVDSGEMLASSMDSAREVGNIRGIDGEVAAGKSVTVGSDARCCQLPEGEGVRLSFDALGIS